MIKNNRLFTFGCSFTHYHYPTWADIVGENFTEFQNWGDPGGGNNFILNSIVECHSRNKLTKDDTVIVMWSGLSRIDHYQINQWVHLHNQYFDLRNNNSAYSCPTGYELLSFAWFASAAMLLHHLGVNWKMFHWQPLDYDSESYATYKDLLLDLQYAPFKSNTQRYKKLQTTDLDLLTDLYQRLSGPDWPELNSIMDLAFYNMALSDHIKHECNEFLQVVQKDHRLSKKYIEEIDLHPSPLQHMAWVERFLPEYTISQDTTDWVQGIDQCLIDQKFYSFLPSRPVRF
jgi:hypothetical protein